MLTLLPQPKTMTMESGAFTLTPETQIIAPREPAGRLRVMTAQLQEEIRMACGVTLQCRCGCAQEGDIRLTLAGDAHAPRGHYTLQLRPEGVRIVSGSVEGLGCGVQTLRQLIRQCGWTLPALTIDDAPSYADRGYYFDVTRGRVPTLAWLKQLADDMCLLKLNQLQLYVEHTFLFRDLTELYATAVTPLTAEEIMALDDYCDARGIELVPSLSSFGHLMELLRTKRFAPLCELPGSDRMPSTMPNRMAHHTIDPTNPESLALILSMIDAYMPLFRSKRFNICADETFDLGRGRSAQAVACRGEKSVYTGYVRALCEHVAAQGHTPMFWGDIVVKFADALSELPGDTVCLNWGYSADETEDSTRILAAAGARQYVCPGVSSWNRWMPHLRASYENIRRMAEYGVKYGAIGLLNTDWGDYGHISDPRFSLPGMAFGACAAWNGTLPDFDALCGSVSRLLYGDRSGSAVGVLAHLAEAPVYGWWHIVRFKEDAQGLLTDAWGKPEGQAVPDQDFLAGQRRMEQAERALRACCMQMDTAQRDMIGRWLNGAEAIRLWDAAYHLVCQGKQDASLAQRLERWLHRYEAMWRETSAESELWRIRDVTVWYADRLR